MVQLIFCWFFSFDLPFSITPNSNSSDTEDETLVESPFLLNTIYEWDGTTVTPILQHELWGCIFCPYMSAVCYLPCIQNCPLAPRISHEENVPFQAKYHNTPLEVPMDLSHSRGPISLSDSALSPFCHHLQVTFLQEQNYTFAKLAEEVDSARFYKLFDGPPTWLLPVYDATTLFSGIIKSVGKIISHATAQCAIGFPHL